MSALGQKRTLAVQNAMSALPPRADIRSALPYVCFGPIADMDLKMATRQQRVIGPQIVRETVTLNEHPSASP